ncbi:MAG: type II toxin-antitoxin system RelB/DinJ family antitoxin [Ruminococcus sp.]|nr:type II toxin-antitoxin system RelB/DinJ family antitoxin [Ruminococcus sp.]
MATANLNIRIDSDVKEKAAALFSELGLTMTAAVEMFLRQSIEEKKIPFKPEAEKTLDERLSEAIEKRNTPVIALPTDKNGHIYIDKDKYPDLYDWAVNG